MRLGENSFIGSADATTASTVVALDSAAEVLNFTPSVPCRILRYGVIVGVTLDNTPNGLVLALRTRDIGGSLTTRATLTRAADDAVGTHIWRDVPKFEMVTGLDKNVVVPGHQVVLEVTTAATAGDGHVYIEFTPLSQQVSKQVGSSNVHYPIEATA